MFDKVITKSQIVSVTTENLDHLYDLWRKMFDKPFFFSLSGKLATRLNEFYGRLLNETMAEKKSLEDKINSFENEADVLKRLLGMKVSIDPKPRWMPLDARLKMLESQNIQWRNELTRRHDEIAELLEEQDELCEELGGNRMTLSTDPLPTSEEMKAFQSHLEYLRKERKSRLDEVIELRSQIQRDMMHLSQAPLIATGGHVFNLTKHSLTPDAMEKLRNEQLQLSNQVHQMGSNINSVRDQVCSMWDRMKATNNYILRRVSSVEDYTQSTYDVLRQELDRCQSLHRSNLEIFISQLRAELEYWWEITLKSDEERNLFRRTFNEPYTEKMLFRLEDEVNKLKNFYNNNKKIFELYSARGELWNRMEILEFKTIDSNYPETGGEYVLDEARERKAIVDKLAMIENQISELIKDFNRHSNKCLSIFGESMEERIANDWKRFKQAKERQILDCCIVYTAPPCSGRSDVSDVPSNPFDDMDASNDSEDYGNYEPHETSIFMTPKTSFTYSLFSSPEVSTPFYEGAPFSTTGILGKRANDMDTDVEESAPSAKRMPELNSSDSFLALPEQQSSVSVQSYPWAEEMPVHPKKTKSKKSKKTSETGEIGGHSSIKKKNKDSKEHMPDEVPKPTIRVIKEASVEYEYVEPLNNQY